MQKKRSAAKRLCGSFFRLYKSMPQRFHRPAYHHASGGHAAYPLQTSTHSAHPEYRSSSGIVSSIALFALPHAGNTVAKRFSDTSRQISTPSLTANGHTPPTAWPTSVSASCGESIFAFVPNRALYLGLSIFASPADAYCAGFGRHLLSLHSPGAALTAAPDSAIINPF